MTHAPPDIPIVLLVEDDEADAHLIRLAFKKSRLRADLHHVVDGVDALAFLQRADDRFRDAPRPHLILLDLNMPRMDGHELLTRIKADEDLRAIPVVVLTTSDVEREVRTSYAAGAAGYIVKPAEIDELIASIDRLESYWFATVRLPDQPH